LDGVCEKDTTQSVPWRILSPLLIEELMVSGGGAALTLTVALLLALPPEPLQDKLYVEVDVGLTLWLPEVALAPLQAPEALQEVALAELQDSVDEEPEVIEEGLAERETVGGGGVPLDDGGQFGGGFAVEIPKGGI
jgi:hypothetical protein